MFFVHVLFQWRCPMTFCFLLRSSMRITYSLLTHGSFISYVKPFALLNNSHAFPISISTLKVMHCQKPIKFLIWTWNLSKRQQFLQFRLAILQGGMKIAGDEKRSFFLQRVFALLYLTFDFLFSILGLRLPAKYLNFSSYPVDLLFTGMFVIRPE